MANPYDHQQKYPFGSYFSPLSFQTENSLRFSFVMTGYFIKFGVLTDVSIKITVY
jgi:hypothetical protein